MIYPSTKAGIAQLVGLANFIDEGSNNATFIFYNDNKPSDISANANDTAKLITLTLPKPCIKQTNDDSIDLKPTDTAIATQAGTAKWARLFNGNGIAVADFEVGTDITLANTDIAEGGTLSLTSFKLRPYIKE